MFNESKVIILRSLEDTNQMAIRENFLGILSFVTELGSTYYLNSTISTFQVLVQMTFISTYQITEYLPTNKVIAL